MIWFHLYLILHEVALNVTFSAKKKSALFEQLQVFFIFSALCAVFKELVFKISVESGK